MLIPTSKNVKNITDFRKDPDSILEAVQGKSDPLYLFRGSEPKAVVIDIEEFARLRERLEDYYDFMLVQELAEVPVDKKKLIPLDEFLEEMGVPRPKKNSDKPKK